MSAEPDIQHPLQETDPRIEREIEVVLAGGKITKSYEGTSQYAHKGISACGLASCNAVRLVLDLEKEGVTGLNLVRRMMSRELVEVSRYTFWASYYLFQLTTLWYSYLKQTVGICSTWSSSAHLEVEEILALPLFSRDLRLIGTEYDQCSYAKYLVLFR